jgi:hypothetical protein
VAEPAEVRAFREGWLDWSREQGIDYFCADPAWWTQTIAFTAAAGRVA